MGQAHALVLSGGGAKGAYEVGVMKALFGGASPATGRQPIAVGIYTGTSVGSYNAAVMAAQGDLPGLAAVELLERIWCTQVAATPARCGNGVYRVRGLPFQGLDPGCFLHPLEAATELAADAASLSRSALVRGLNLVFSQAPLQTRAVETIDIAAFISAEPLQALVRDTLDFDRLRASPKSLTVVASNWRDGTWQLFSKTEIANRGGVPVLASTAIPGFFPPVVIDGVPYVDGGATLNTPLLPAIREGAEVLHVIYLDPRTERIPFPELPNTPDTLYRLYSILIANTIQSDVLTAGILSEAVELAGEPRAEQAAEGKGLPRALRRVRQRLREGRPYRRLTIHQYRPSTDMGGVAGLFDFSSAVIDRFIELGYSDTVNHDCEQAGCSVHAPAGQPGGAAPAAAGTSP
ncbi:MAG TPA: patatin-like phospholipase family protein [Thermoanaerobaculia bacterium]|nr:patatin-like phospholipase family protein [Thermoanaerobaculia bacterium]